MSIFRKPGQPSTIAPPLSARRRFRVSPEDYRDLENTARERRLEILGFYHSHTDHPAVPSEYDRENALPWYSYLIVSVRARRADEVLCWTLAEDRSRFERDPIRTERRVR